MTGMQGYTTHKGCEEELLIREMLLSENFECLGGKNC